MSREITPDEDFSALEMGRAIHEIYYERMRREISFEGIKLDVLERGERIVCEVKTSSRFLKATTFQLLYYLYRLGEMGVKMRGEIRVPKERRKIYIYLNDNNKKELLEALEEIKRIIELEKPPKPDKTMYCKRCAYKEFCWV